MTCANDPQTCDNFEVESSVNIGAIIGIIIGLCLIAGLIWSLSKCLKGGFLLRDGTKVNFKKPNEVVEGTQLKMETLKEDIKEWYREQFIIQVEEEESAADHSNADE